MKLILTCEHFSAEIPGKWKGLFAGAGAELRSHRGWDIGVHSIYDAFLPEALAGFRGRWSRLLIDLNRSTDHRHCFSEFTAGLPAGEREEIVETVHRPFRCQVWDKIKGIVDRGECVLHLSVHTFTPEWNGSLRTADFGILYDPARLKEKRLAENWRRSLSKIGHVRMNYPYRGTADGHVTALRQVFLPSQYLGIELEVNQGIASERALPAALVDTFRKVDLKSDTR